MIETWRLILVGISVFSFLFIIFQKLKEDYSREDVVSFSLLTLLLGGVLVFLSFYFSLELELVFSILSLVLSTFCFSYFRGWRFWDTLESLSLPGLIVLLIVSFNQLTAGPLLITILSSLFWKRYRSFHWYQSGRVGFLFLALLATLALFSLLLDFWQGRLLKLAVWLAVLIITLVAIFFLSERKKTSLAN